MPLVLDRPSQLRIVVDDFARTSDNPLEQALQFEEDIAPILLFIFVSNAVLDDRSLPLPFFPAIVTDIHIVHLAQVDCPLEDAKKRAPASEADRIEKEYKEWEVRMGPLIKHYRDKANFLEVS